jgi:hypothetical protein
MLNTHGVFDKSIASECMLQYDAPIFIDSNDCPWASLHYFRINSAYKNEIAINLCGRGDFVAGYWKDTRFTRCLASHGVKLTLYNKYIIWDFIYYIFLMLAFIAYVIFICKHLFEKGAFFLTFIQNIGQFGLFGIISICSIVTLISIASISVSYVGS